ncbi:transposable element Tcb2 transposase [Trichonephila clavipes]|nr:transposable element Tcb2 transposase [Trichonephila clavipes]
MFGRRIAARQPPPTCLPELWRALLDEWCNIPQDQIDNLILSIPRHCLGSADLSSFQALCAEDLWNPTDRNLLPENLVKSRLSGHSRAIPGPMTLGARYKRPKDKLQ